MDEAVAEFFLKDFVIIFLGGDHPGNNLPNFGYIPDMKVFFLKTHVLLYSWLPAGTYHIFLVFLEFFPLEIWQIWAIFVLKNTLYMPKSYFSGQNLAKLWQL
jgi:hypothetical protein